MAKEERAESIFGWIVAVTVGVFYLLFAWALPFPGVNQLNRRGSLRERFRREGRESHRQRR
jgi:hypothetical protein